MDVLLTNDDGINADGLRHLYAALIARGHHVNVVAPVRQQSGVGHSLTVFEPLRSKKIVDGDFEGNGIYGTPTDCVKLGLGCLSPRRPDLVMSGINLGPNAGPDLFYSGTVGAAAEAAHDNVPSMAISWGGFSPSPLLGKIAEHAVGLAEKIDWQALAPRRVINVNYPNLKVEDMKGLRVCPQSLAVWRNIYEERKDPRGSSYWWLDGDVPKDSILEGTDKDLLARGYITVTPLRFEYTDEAGIAALEKMGL
ncbi:MAG: 5'/3'-nucleotidase SurE [Desulfovibrio sp.]|jgi:5'-nucleotidase|nr:5'/3'-nucleotidase SurE [Desulfovibrio sp.]